MGSTSRSLWKNVLALGFVSFLADVASELVFPILPSFVSTVLGAGAVGLGIVEGIADSTASIVKLVAGRISDRMPSRKPLVVAGYTISGLSKPLVGLAHIMPIAALARFFDRVGKGVRTAPRDALIGDSVEPARRGFAFGLHRSMDHLGAVVGALTCSALLWVGLAPRSFFFWASIPGMLAVLVVLLGVTEPRRESTISRSQLQALGAFSALPRPFKVYLGAVSLFALGSSSDAFLLLRLGDTGVALWMIALLWGLHHIVKSVCTYWGGHLTDKIGRMPLIIAGWVFYAFVYVGFGFSTSKSVLIALFLIYGIYFGLSEPAEKAIVTEMVPAEARGSAFGWFHGSIGVMALPASLIFGVIWSAFGARMAFGFGAALSVLACLVLTAAVRSRADQYT